MRFPASGATSYCSSLASRSAPAARSSCAILTSPFQLRSAGRCRRDGALAYHPDVQGRRREREVRGVELALYRASAGVTGLA